MDRLAHPGRGPAGRRCCFWTGAAAWRHGHLHQPVRESVRSSPAAAVWAERGLRDLHRQSSPSRSSRRPRCSAAGSWPSSVPEASSRAHPACPDGVIRRGGDEWPVGDHGAGIWMTFESIRLVLEDIQRRGSNGYHSPRLTGSATTSTWTPPRSSRLSTPIPRWPSRGTGVALGPGGRGQQAAHRWFRHPTCSTWPTCPPARAMIPWPPGRSPDRSGS